MLKKIIKKVVPKKLLLTYHFLLAKLASLFYGNPSNKLIIIGVTGTNGKTTTVNFISQYLECLGQKTGLASTVNFKVDKKEWLNDKKMTMLGRFQTQRLLKDMVEAGCKYAVIETSSQGVEQFRHAGINYDLVVFCNLTPEHIEAHGGFINYRKQKEKLFEHLSKSKVKDFFGKKIIVTNNDDEESDRLKKFKVDKFKTYGFEKTSDYQGSNIVLDDGLVSFEIKNQKIKTNLIGRFNAYNVLASLSAVAELGFEFSKMIDCKINGVPGRQELIEQGQDFKIMIDYAPEPESLKQLYQALKSIPKNRLIHVLGSCGGGRDKARQPVLGKMAGKRADIVVITNEDPYDDDPVEIIDNVASGAIEAGKEVDKDLFKEEDRVKGIEKALKLAKKGDLVLITGKGAEQYICSKNNTKIPHDDRTIVKNLLK